MPVFPLLAALIACHGAESDTDPGLPPETDTPERDTDPVEFPEDTSLDSDLDVSPQHYLTMYERGYWDVSGDLAGELHVQEWLDGGRPDTDTADSAPETDLPLDCDVYYTLTGIPAEHTCSGCDAAWEITFTVLSGTPEMCKDPELMGDGSTRFMAFDPSENAVMMNFGGVGIWLPWYQAAKHDDRVDYTWMATVGVSVEEEDDQ